MGSLENSLTTANRNIENLTSSLQYQENLNQDLRNNTAQLSNALYETQTTVSQLSSINKELTTIVSYLNNTGMDNVSFDVLRSELASQILEKQVLLYGDIHSNYDSKLSNIPCNFKQTFASASWMVNMNAIIGSMDYVKVQNYLNSYYFSPVCASMSDFHHFLLKYPSFGYNESNATVNVLNTAMSVYFSELLLYYFPLPDSSTGLSLDDWIAANFTCESLPLSKKFIYVL
jgi:hypothetical protein